MTIQNSIFFGAFARVNLFICSNSNYKTKSFRNSPKIVKKVDYPVIVKYEKKELMLFDRHKRLFYIKNSYDTAWQARATIENTKNESYKNTQATILTDDPLRFNARKNKKVSRDEKHPVCRVYSFNIMRSGNSLIYRTIGINSVEKHEEKYNYKNFYNINPHIYYLSNIIKNDIIVAII